MTDTQPSHTQTTQDAADPRHARRIALMQLFFTFSFHQHDAARQTEFVAAHPEMAEVVAELPTIDADIHRLAPERPVSEINKVDLAILRIIMFEWNLTKTPKKVLIDEAVELAKEFGTESSPKFVNGVLGKLLEPTEPTKE